jgi:hypothetical protein
MSPSGGLARGARGLFAKLQNIRAANAPDAPALPVRDPWPGDPSRGARIVKAELEFLGATLRGGGGGGYTPPPPPTGTAAICCRRRRW